MDLVAYTKKISCGLIEEDIKDDETQDDIVPESPERTVDYTKYDGVGDRINDFPMIKQHFPMIKKIVSKYRKYKSGPPYTVGEVWDIVLKAYDEALRTYDPARENKKGMYDLKHHFMQKIKTEMNKIVIHNQRNIKERDFNSNGDNSECWYDLESIADSRDFYKQDNCGSDHNIRKMEKLCEKYGNQKIKKCIQCIQNGLNYTEIVNITKMKIKEVIEVDRFIKSL